MIRRKLSIFIAVKKTIVYDKDDSQMRTSQCKAAENY